MKKKREAKEIKDLKSLIDLTPKGKIQQLRDIVQPRGKKGTWLRFLNDNRLCEVYYRLKSGQPAYKIARIAQERWGIKREAKTESMSRAVRAFKDKALADLDSGKYHSTEKKKGSKRARQFLKNLNKKIDGMVYMAELIQIQMERVKAFYSGESEMPIGQAEESVKVLFNGIEKYVKLQIQLGVLDSKPDELKVLLHHQFGGVLEHVIKDRGDTMEQFATKLLENLEASSIPLVQGKNGEYHLPVEAIGTGENSNEKEQ